MVQTLVITTKTSVALGRVFNPSSAILLAGACRDIELLSRESVQRVMRLYEDVPGGIRHDQLYCKEYNQRWSKFLVEWLVLPLGYASAHVSKDQDHHFKCKKEGDKMPRTTGRSGDNTAKKRNHKCRPTSGPDQSWNRHDQRQHGKDNGPRGLLFLLASGHRLRCQGVISTSIAIGAVIIAHGAERVLATEGIILNLHGYAIS